MTKVFQSHSSILIAAILKSSAYRISSYRQNCALGIRFPAATGAAKTRLDLSVNIFPSFLTAILYHSACIILTVQTSEQQHLRKFFSKNPTINKLFHNKKFS